VDDTANDIYAQRITKTGALLDGSGRRISDDSKAFPSDENDPDVAWNGSTYLIVYRRTASGNQSISGRAIRPDGSVAFNGAIAFSLQTGVEFAWPAVASNGTSFLVAYSERFPSSETGLDVMGAVVSDFDADPDVVPISQADGDQRIPAIAFNGNYMVAWEDHRNGSQDLWGGRVKPNGDRLDGEGTLLTEYHPSNVAVALAKGGTKGDQFALSWDATPANQQVGIIAYGVQFAPK
jgi:hypothetical protein